MGFYRHILIPTDGSRDSEKAAAAGIQLGKAFGSRVTVVHIVARVPSSRLEAWAHSDVDFRRRVENSFVSRAALVLETIREMAYKEGVICECRIRHGTSPHEEILSAVQDYDCDLVVMASHSLGAETDVMLGGETIKVLTRGPVPVLVYQ